MGTKIQTAKSHFRYSTPDEYRAWLQGLSNKAGAGIVCDCSEIDKKAPPAIAYVNHGRWVADCPSGCGGAMLLDPDMPFMCGNCFNAEIDGKWRLVEWPKERLKIEYFLERRKLAVNANWTLRETVDDLKAENEERGVD